MSRYRLVDLQREKTHVRPVVKATEFRILAAAWDRLLACFADQSLLRVVAVGGRQGGRMPILATQGDPAP